MSVEVKLDWNDYSRLEEWFTLAFGRKDPKDIDSKDIELWTKIEVMAKMQGEVEDAFFDEQWMKNHE